MVHGPAQERREIEDSGDGIGRRDEARWRLRIERLPIRREHGGGEMAPGGMAEYHHWLAGTQPEKQAGMPDLIDDLRNGHLRAEVIAHDGNGDALRIGAARCLAEQ